MGFRNSSILLSVCSEFPERVWKADIKHWRRKRKSCKWFGHFYSTHYCFYSVFVIIKSHVNMSVFRRVAVKELLYKCWVKTTEPSSTVKQIIRDVNETFFSRPKRDLSRFPRDRDKTETFNWLQERPKLRPFETQTKLLASNCYKWCIMSVMKIISQQRKSAEIRSGCK